MTRQQSIGRWGENLAAEFFTKQGWEIIARNERTPYGELDLIARCNEGLVFVEVKTRTSDTYGLPETAITPRKRAHLIDAAEHYLQAHPELAGDWRIDVVAISGSPAHSNPQIEWFENAVS